MNTVDPMILQMIEKIQNSMTENLDGLQRKFNYVSSDKLSINGATLMPIKLNLMLYYDLQIRDTTLDLILSPLELLLQTRMSEGVDIGEVIKSMRKILTKNPAVEAWKQGIGEIEQKFTERDEIWDK